MLRKNAALVAAAAVIGAMAMPAQAAEVTLTGASCFPIGSPVSKPFEAVVNEVNKQGKGVLQIKMVGGAPAIGSPFTLTQKMAKGAYDMVGCTEAYFGNVLPEAPVLRFSDYSYPELRQNGAIDYMQKLFNAKGLQFIARHHTFGTFHLYTNKKITGADLTGMNIRVSPVYTAFFKSLGATVQTSTIAQVYTYMENNTVQGFGWPLMGWIPAWAKVTKFRVDPGFYDGTLHTLVNLKKWNSLDKTQQGLLNKVGLMFEGQADPASAGFKALAKKQKAWFASNGVKTIALSGAERDKWVSAAKAEGWKEVLARSPEHGPKLQKLFTK
jgi:TRAP-type C4-dicarboxylate transport system substrate-binding protein